MYVSIPDCFMISFFVGLVFGLVYEVLRILRLLLPFKAAIFLFDVAFFVLAASAVMSLSEMMGSYIRIYTILGFGAGVFTYIVTVGRLFNIAENAASNAWRKAIRNAFRACSSAVRRLFSTIAHKCKPVIGKIAEYRKGKLKKSFQGLKSDNEIVYNKKRLEKIGGKTDAIKANVRRNT